MYFKQQTVKSNSGFEARVAGGLIDTENILDRQTGGMYSQITSPLAKQTILRGLLGSKFSSAQRVYPQFTQVDETLIIPENHGTCSL